VDTQLVVVGVVPHFDLRQHLVGEAGAHHEGAFVATVNFERNAFSLLGFC